MQKQLVSRLGTRDRGIISRPNLSVLHRTEMASIIAEIGYMTNYKERQRLSNTNFKQKAASAVATAIEKALK